MRFMIVSPHNDDAAYSMGGWLLSRPHLARETCIVSVFTKSEFAPYLPALQNDIERVTLQRTAENEAFCSTVGTRRFDLGLSEASLRGSYPTVESLFVAENTVVSDSCQAALGNAIGDILAEVRPQTVYLPAGIAGHVDHLLVRDGFISAIQSTAEVWLYEDLPYAGELAQNALMEALARLPCAEPSLLPFGPDTAQKKLALLSLYRSQVGEKDLQAVSCHWRRIGGERLWRHAAQRV